MVARLIRWSIGNPLFVLLATLLLGAWGVVSILHTPLDAIPDLSRRFAAHGCSRLRDVDRIGDRIRRGETVPGDDVVFNGTARYHAGRRLRAGRAPGSPPMC